MAQRRHARFVNTTMMVTGLGAAVSDALEDGRVVSGVGGQYNFVAMAHALPEARSILCLRATRDGARRSDVNILWSYGHTTIPRHLRDIVVTEYGIADLRGRTDREVVEALVAIMDARFQERFVADAQRAGKLPRDYRIPDAARSNHPQRLAGRFAPWRGARPVRGAAVRQRLHAGRGRAGQGAARLAGRDRSWPGKVSATAAGAASGRGRRRDCSPTWPGWSCSAPRSSASACSAAGRGALAEVLRKVGLKPVLRGPRNLSALPSRPTDSPRSWKDSS